ncbi:MAG TPA: hypothetical protein ENK56_05410 [Chloroflexi bacterium]|nr:hypothetical protein [Chloroflexota bacterium]
MPEPKTTKEGEHLGEKEPESPSRPGTLTVKCPYCGRLHRFPPSYVGQSTTCKGCGRVFVIRR